MIKIQRPHECVLVEAQLPDFPVIAQNHKAVNAAVFSPSMNLLGKVILSFAVKNYLGSNCLIYFLKLRK